jgi:hypothetical protein
MVTAAAHTLVGSPLVGYLFTELVLLVLVLCVG